MTQEESRILDLEYSKLNFITDSTWVQIKPNHQTRANSDCKRDQADDF